MVSASTPLHFTRKKERRKTDSGFYKRTQVAGGSWGKGDTDCSAESSPPDDAGSHPHRVAQGWDECQ